MLSMNASAPTTRCLVTGASGFVGRVLCDTLQREKVHVKVLLRKPLEGPWDEVVTGHLESFADCGKHLFENVDTIFYLASIAHHKAPASHYKHFNVDVCLAFAKAALAAGVKRFIYVSSSKAVADLPGQRIDEQVTRKPLDPYGKSKRQAEEGLLALEGFEHLVILRPCLVYGENLQGNLRALVRQLDKGVFPALPVTAARRSMVSVRDVARAAWLVSITPHCHRQVYFVADDVDYAVSDLEKAIRKALGTRQPPFAIPVTLLSLAGRTGDLFSKLLPGFPVNSETIKKLTASALYSSQKLRDDTGWKPTENFYDALPAIVEAYRRADNRDAS